MDRPQKMWFAAKSLGFGAGLPISWEGWGVLAGFFLGVVALRTLSHLYFGIERTEVSIGGFVLLGAALFWLCRGRTEGGWRWRSGD